MIHLRIVPDRKQAAAEVVRDLQDHWIAKQIERSPDKVTRHKIQACDFHQTGGN